MNLPNKLTMMRILIVPIIIIICVFNIGSSFSFTLLKSTLTLNHLMMVILFAIASITDLLDGKIARSRNLVTTFGKFMDPIADKMLVNVLLIILAYQKCIPLLCVLIMIMRDLVVDGVRLMASQKQIVIAAGPLGKLKTVMQMIAIIAILINNFPLGFLGIDIGLILIWIATVISVISGIDYFMKSKDMIFESI